MRRLGGERIRGDGIGREGGVTGERVELEGITGNVVGCGVVWLWWDVRRRLEFLKSGYVASFIVIQICETTLHMFAGKSNIISFQSYNAQHYILL